MAVTVAAAETAITAIQDGGQSFTLDGVTYTMANLAALIDLRDRLKRETERSAGSRPVFRAMDFGSMGYS